MEKNLNPEQLSAVKHGSGPLLIIAGAGTGKTTVITERIKHLLLEKKIEPHEILALTFTDKAAFEMEERVDKLLPYGYSTLEISTFHAFCERVLRDESVHIGLSPYFTLMDEAESILFFKKHIHKLSLSYFKPLSNPTKFAGAILTHFSRLRDEDITSEQYLKFAEKIEDPDEKIQYLELAKVYEEYEKIKKQESVMDFSDVIANVLHLFRTKPNVLKRYQARFKFVLVDEFQDTNYAQNLLSIMLSGDDHNITVVADDDQCLPGNSKILTPEGEVAIKNLKIGDSVVTAVGKGYLSTSKISHVNISYKQARLLKLTTESGEIIELTDNHKMFCMVPARKFGDKKNYFVYLMRREGMGWRLGITDDLAQRLKLERSADLIIGIKSYSSLEEALLSETILSMKYQIPKYPFKPRKQMRLTGEWLDKLFSSFDTEKNALALAEGEGIDLQSYHYCLDGVVRGNKTRVKVHLNMCARRNRSKTAKDRLLYPPKVLHEVRLETSSEEVKKSLDKSNILTGKSKQGWRVRKMFANLHEAGEFARKLKRITNGVLEAGFYVGKRNGVSRNALIMPAKNILVGMYVPVKHGYEVIYERVIERKENIREITVYDIEVERTHNFIANNIVVHNSIYRWRGASISNVLQFKKNFPEAETITLVNNYRSTQPILNSSYKMIQNNNPDRLEVQEKIDKHLISARKTEGVEPQVVIVNRFDEETDFIVTEIRKLVKKKKYSYEDIAILVRANNHAHAITSALSRNKIPYQLGGPGQLLSQPEIKDLIAYLTVLSDVTDSVSLFKVLSMPIFNIKAVELSYILGTAKRENWTLFESLEKIQNDKFIKAETKEKLFVIKDMIGRHLERTKVDTPGQILYYFVTDSGLAKTLLEGETATTEAVTQNIARFFDMLKNFELTTRETGLYETLEWLNILIETGESPSAATLDLGDIDAVHVQTVHGSKGLEYPVVFLVNLVNGRFPTRERSEKLPIPESLIKETLPAGDFHTQEERRLFYVGMTRAKDLLYLTAAKYYGEGKRERKISPFVFEAVPEAKEVTRTTRQQLSLPTLLEELKPQEKIEGKGTALHLTSISYTQIQTFDICPLHYKARYILGLPTPPSASQSFGISIHETLDEFYKIFLSGEKVSKKLLISLLPKHWKSAGYDGKVHEDTALQKAEEILSSYFDREFKEEHKPIALEMPFSFWIDNNNLRVGGKIDRIDQQNGKIKIIDYKTGKPNNEKYGYTLQLGIYALAASKVKHPLLSKKPEEVTLELQYVETGEKIEKSFTEEELKNFEKEIIEKVRQIEQSDFKCSESPLCKSCEFQILCSTNI